MKEELFLEIQEVFRKVFGNPDLVIQKDMVAGDITDWDSLRHMTLIAEIEERFTITFTYEEASSFKNIGDMVKLIEAKIK